MSPNDIQRKHKVEREIIVDDALQSSLDHLVRAHSHFGSAIQDPGLHDEFSDGLRKARDVLAKLGIEK